MGHQFQIILGPTTGTLYGNYHIVLAEYTRGRGFSKEGWRRWADLKPVIEGGTNLVLGAQKHPARNTAPEDVELFSKELSIPVVPKDTQCE